ncbi:LysE family translocator [Pseudorhodoferax sp.]|uniref:LysE family translocator n=1 Tax=Pseudorhodoferax sp. TaxID=1993553 RepID=UPI0039E3C43F
MPELHQLLLFVAAGWLLNLTPGPDVLCIVRHALRGGARAGIVAGLGVTAGCCVHVAAAAVGVGALLAASAAAFSALKWLGAAYLLYVGVKLLRARPGARPLAQAAGPAAGRALVALRRVFLDGFCTNVLNPKVALFFLAFVPQFIAPGAPDAARAFVLLGALFNLNAMPVHVGWALAAAWLARRSGGVQRGMHWLDRAAGVLFVGFGLRLALADAPAVR